MQATTRMMRIGGWITFLCGALLIALDHQLDDWPGLACLAVGLTFIALANKHAKTDRKATEDIHNLQRDCQDVLE